MQVISGNDQESNLSNAFMLQNFVGVKCQCNRPVQALCITDNCEINPFVCQTGNECILTHNANCCIKSLKDIDKDIKTILKFQFFIVYSSKHKGNSIHIAGRYALQTRPPPINQRFALTYDPIPLGTTQCISFRLTKIKGCVGVGIFIRQVLQKNQYKYIPDSQYLNHGGYMLLSNNLLYSHSQKQQNVIQIKKFDVKQKDIIKVKYQKDKVTFISHFLEQSLNIDLKPGQHIHFGVYLYDVEDEVQIVNTFIHGE